MNNSEALNIILQIVSQSSIKVADAPTVLTAIDTLQKLVSTQQRNESTKAQ